MKEPFNLLHEPLAFEEAIEYFGEKFILTSKEFYDLSDEYRGQAFTVARYSEAGVLNKFYEALDKGLKEGTDINAFRNEMNDFLKNKGYKGITNYQADNIFRTNIQTAYSVGHHKQMTDPAVTKLRPYWLYDAVDDNHTRLTHRAMNRKVFAFNNPIWDIWYPPNGFKCRCGVITLSERQVKLMRLEVLDKAPRAAVIKGIHVNVYPDRNFSTNPAKHAFKPDVSKFPEPLQKAYKNQISKNA